MYELSDLMEIRVWIVFQLRSIFALVMGHSDTRVVLVSVAYYDSIGSLSNPTISIMSNIYAIMLGRENVFISLVSMTSIYIYNDCVPHVVIMPPSSPPPHNS